MSETPTTLPNLADHLRRLLEAVKDACAMSGHRWGLLAGPMALLMWIRTRRMRKEMEAAAKQFAAMIEQLLALLEDFRAGKLTAQNAPPVEYPPPQPSPSTEDGVRAEVKPRDTLPRPRYMAPVHVARMRSNSAAAKAPASQTPSATSFPPLRSAAGLPPPPDLSRGLIRAEGPAKREGEVLWPANWAGFAWSLFLNGTSGGRVNCVHFVTIT